MAVLTDAQFTQFKHALRRKPAARAQMRNAALSKAQWKALLQSIEDSYDSNRLAAKVAAEAAAGVSISNGLARALEDVWMDERAAR